jgi:hypothetical protein
VQTPFETLESRLLLSAIRTDGGNTPLAVPIPVASVILVEPNPVVNLTADSTLSFPLAPTPTSFTARQAMGGPLIAVVSPPVTAPVAAYTRMITVVSTTSGSLDEDSVTPVIVVATPSNQSPFASSASEATPPGFAGSVGLPSAPPGVNLTSSDPAGSAQGGFRSWGGGGQIPGSSDGSDSPAASSPSTPPPTSSGEAAVVPDSRHVEVVGSLDGTHGYLTLRIPIGPTVRELGLSVHGGSGSNPSQGLVFGQMSVVDRNGDTLEQLGPLSDSSQGGSSDAVTLSLNDVPVGGTLLVQVSTPSGAVAPGPSASGSSSTGSAGTLPFVMDVQRLESAANGATGGLGAFVGQFAALGQSAIGTLPGSWDHQGQGQHGSGASSNPETTNTVATTVVDPGEPGLTGDDATSDGTPSADLAARIATGPLAARSAAPIGPNLSTVLLDPAPAIDRHERALSQELAANDADEDQESQHRSIDPGDPDSSPDGPGGDVESDEFDPRGATVISIAGLGPLRLRVSRPGVGDRRADLETLRTALSDAMGGDEQLAGVGVEDAASDALLVAMASPRASEMDRRPTPDYLTSACILALGMGLVTGPIIPDLLRLLPSRSSRWRAAQGGAPSSHPGAGTRDRGFGAWLRRRLVP